MGQFWDCRALPSSNVQYKPKFCSLLTWKIVLNLAHLNYCRRDQLGIRYILSPRAEDGLLLEAHVRLKLSSGLNSIVAGWALRSLGPTQSSHVIYGKFKTTNESGSKWVGFIRVCTIFGHESKLLIKTIAEPRSTMGSRLPDPYPYPN